jgi:hypothetical protein
LAPPGLLPQQSNPQLYFNNGNQQKLTPPQYQQPLSGGAGAPSVALPYATIQQQQDGGVPTESFAEKPETGGQNNDKISAQPDETIDDFYSVLLVCF